MARDMCRWRTSRWFFSIQLALYLFVVIVDGLEETDESNKSEKNLILEYFLPYNQPREVKISRPTRERRDVEGSGDFDSFTHLADKDEKSSSHDVAEKTLELAEKKIDHRKNDTEFEGSGDDSFNEDKDKENTNVPLIGESEILTTTIESPNGGEAEKNKTEEPETATAEEPTAENVTEEEVATVVVQHGDADEPAEVTTEAPAEEMTTTENEAIAPAIGVTSFINSVTATVPALVEKPADELSSAEVAPEKTEVSINTTPQEVHENEPEAELPKAKAEEIPVTTAATPPDSDSNATKVASSDSEEITRTDEPVMEPIFTETKMATRTLEAPPGNILQKKNLTLGVDPLLIVTNTGMMESEEAVQDGESRRLGAYIVIALILLSFSSLVGYIMFRKRQNRKRHHDFEANQESNDTEKALLSLSDYKDNSELEENHLKNNEITPIVVKSNSSMNKFEKNTNFSSPKNLNTKANEKNVEKDNVLKSTSENLTQVIVEDSPKDAEDKNLPSMEKLIVKTRVDQDSIPKKPIIVNRSSTGYVPIPQENS